MPRTIQFAMNLSERAVQLARAAQVHLFITFAACWFMWAAVLVFCWIAGLTEIASLDLGVVLAIALSPPLLVYFGAVLGVWMLLLGVWVVLLGINACIATKRLFTGKELDPNSDQVLDADDSRAMPAWPGDSWY